MKLIGRQIVVELPKKWKQNERQDSAINDACFTRNDVITEMTSMNSALEIDENKMYKIAMETKGFMADKIHALASNPSAWLKRKEVMK